MTTGDETQRDEAQHDEAQVDGAAGTGRRPARRSRPPLPEHLRRRRRLLGWSAPVVLAFLVTGSLLLGTAFGNLLGTRDYEAMRFPQAAQQFQAQQRWTGFAEQWKAWFNSGTAQYRAEEHFLAVEDLRVALEHVPVAGPLPGGPEGSKAPQSPECRVRTNLSLAIEAMGDVAATADDPGMAAAYYAEAQEVIEPCISSQENEESSDRQQDKEDEARDDEQEPDEQPSPQPDDGETEDPTEDPTDEPTDEPTGEPTDGPTEEPTTAPEPTQDPQREELEERNREAERDRQEEQQRRGGGSPGGQSW